MSGGVYYYRVYTPMKALAEKHPDEFDITIDNHWKFTPQEIDEIGKNYSIVWIHNCLYISEIQEEVWKMIIYCRKVYFTKFILDLDDYWDYNKFHPQYNISQFNAFPDKMMINFKLFDYITTTTEYFKIVISEYFSSDRIYVFPNAISLKDHQFSTYKTESHRIRLGITGGSSHTEDIKQLLEFPKYLTEKQLNQIELVFCGYDTKNAEKLEIDENGKVISRNKLDLSDNWWVKTENKFKQELKYYTRVESKSIVNGEYGGIYKDIDVLLIPLCNNKFNRCKSELKLIEAGFTNTAFICSDVIPYNNFSKANLGFNFIKNPNPQEWAKSIKKIIRNPELIEEIKRKNREQILQSRTLEEINKLRYEFLKQII
jgi:glycosyltransferase involved in cell wall biosynthesis